MIEAVVHLHRRLAQDKELELSSRSGADAGYILADRGIVSQILSNLLLNSIKFTPQGGRVEVSVTHDDAWGILEVADTGVGIAPEDRSRVWDRLFRGDRSRAERGLGLGLSLVKAVVEAHGGEVELRSGVEGGSTFQVRLRLASAATVAPRS